MFQYHRLGSVPAKHHIQHRRSKEHDVDGCPVYYEHCLTRWGFEAGYSVAYRLHNPGREETIRDLDYPVGTFEIPSGEHHHRHHLPTLQVERDGHLYEATVWWTGNADIRMGAARPTTADTPLTQNGDGDLLLFFHAGGGRLESELGGLTARKHDYVFIPKGLVHQWHLEPDSHVLVMEAPGGIVIPSNFLNDVGQLRMDAPYCHRDFRKPDALSQGTGACQIAHKRHDRWTLRDRPNHPFDVVGYDGTVYPVAFNIWDYEPKMGRTHLPPPIHTTFLAGNGKFVVCSFVPRAVDDHPEAIPCPYPHSSYDCDEVLWYVEGNFTSRKGVGPASMSFHPAGIPHAPQPGRYEASIGTVRTDEMAVMVDTYVPLGLSEEARTHTDPQYHTSWNA